ncbi:LemA family protein [Planktosalinus lacus]|uniref:Membrane protein n=1 Tax=Planktosalinus lacus TaxID=1526573 RepID=A0A8J2V6S8_9FLAO|nr:LemA family protein [Planktosalinus lacus]GGD84044.1 membrane protein [Planktosalinus lacus]
MTLVVISLVILVIVYCVYIYNSLIRLRTMVNEAWSGIDVQLQKRHDLIPNIVKVVQGYAAHEKNLFESITQLRTRGMEATEVKEQEAAEVGLSKALGKLFVVVENYPELKANQNFLELQKELAVVENDLQRARRYYNGSVRNYNIMIEQFPSMFIAKAANHSQREFFDIKNETEKAVPNLNF